MRLGASTLLGTILGMFSSFQPLAANSRGMACRLKTSAMLRAVATRHRYTRSEVEGMLGRAGFRVVRASYWNTTLVPLLWLVRRLGPRAPVTGWGH